MNCSIDPIMNYPSPTLAESSKEDAHRLHSYTVTENERVLTAEFPLQRQHDNERSQHERLLMMPTRLSASPAGCFPRGAGWEDCRSSNSRTQGQGSAHGFRPRGTRLVHAREIVPLDL